MKNEEENKRPTRTRRNQTERKKHKGLYYAVIGILMIILILLVASIFTGGNDPEPNLADALDSSTMMQKESAASDSAVESTDTSEPEEEVDSSEEDTEEKTEEETEEEEEPETEPAEPSDDLVVDAYTGDWDPIGTSQEGTHTTNFSSGSQDRIEIKQATASVPGLNPDSMIEWWVGNDGPNKVVATVSDREQSEIYRVYLSWVDNEGWQPTKVEELRENDKN